MRGKSGEPSQSLYSRVKQAIFHVALVLAKQADRDNLGQSRGDRWREVPRSRVLEIISKSRTMQSPGRLVATPGRTGTEIIQDLGAEDKTELSGMTLIHIRRRLSSSPGRNPLWRLTARTERRDKLKLHQAHQAEKPARNLSSQTTNGRRRLD